MDALLEPLPLWGLFFVMAVFLFTLSKGADILVTEAVTLSLRWGVPTIVIGATIVSLGTTLPEMAVSVMAAVQGDPGLALGNAVGSIICDTGLILGLAALLRPIPLDKRIVNRQGYVQLGAGLLLVLLCVPWASPAAAFSAGGRLPQWGGLLLVALLVLYIWKSIAWARRGAPMEMAEAHADAARIPWVVVKLAAGIAIVIGSSKVLIPAAQLTAARLGVPEAIIGATLVAFGTSLPELTTAITATRRGHGALALGNVIGADILNVFFVAGMAAAVTPGGLQADPRFFRLLFPAMLFLLLVFRASVWISMTELRRWSGALLVAAYLLVTVLSYAQ